MPYIHFSRTQSKLASRALCCLWLFVLIFWAIGSRACWDHCPGEPQLEITSGFCGATRIWSSDPYRQHCLPVFLWEETIGTAPTIVGCSPRSQYWVEATQAKGSHKYHSCILFLPASTSSTGISLLFWVGGRWLKLILDYVVKKCFSNT